jgi:ABC-type dipeptide/oligopeptide/nickel transport system ATPase subunit
VQAEVNLLEELRRRRGLTFILVNCDLAVITRATPDDVRRNSETV